MKNFVYSYPTRVYFGKGAGREHLPTAPLSRSSSATNWEQK